MRGLLLPVLTVLCCLSAYGADWIRAGLTTNAPVWGVAGGLRFALHPAGFTRGTGGPRGLIRLGYPTLTNGGWPHFWDYRGAKVTQYWRKPASEVVPELQCAVNGRFTYWGGKRPIPGGISYENFELREPFRSGQTFIFGITRRSQ